MSNISYSWPVRFVGNGESLKTVVNKYCKTNTSQKYILNRIADSPFIYNGETIVSGILTLDYSVGYWNNHPTYTFIDGSNTIYIGTLNISDWKTDVIIPTAKKSDLLNFKTFQISIKTNTVKDGESQMYHGNVKISDDKNCPQNTVCIIPYGARLETDASRAGIISYRATDTFCAVSHPTISNKNFIVTVLAIYKS